MKIPGKPRRRLAVALVALAACAVVRAEGNAGWKNPLVKKGYLHSPLVETTPFVFGNRLYLAENYQAFVDSATKVVGADSDKDELRIRDVEADRVVSVALRRHAFGTVFVDGEAVYAFSAKCTPGK